MLKKAILLDQGGTARRDRVSNGSTCRLTSLTHHGPGRTLDGQIDGPWRLRLDPIAKPTERAVGGERRADAGNQRVEIYVTVGPLCERLYLRLVLLVMTQQRKCHLRRTRLTVAQDQQACGRDALGQPPAAKRGGGQRRKPRIQRGEDGFATDGHFLSGMQFYLFTVLAVCDHP